MSETDLIMATQHVSLLRMQLGLQHQAVLRAQQEGGAAYEYACAEQQVLRMELKAAETALRSLYTGPQQTEPLVRAA